MNENDEFVRKLRERYEKGEISRETYEDILKRYREEKKNSEEIEIKDKKRDYRCAGSCTLPSGEYEDISAAGSVEITGDIVAKKISLSGAVKSNGNIKADVLKCAGSTKIEGTLECEEINIAGTFSGMKIKGESIYIGGKAEVESIKGENISIGGAVETKSIKGEKIKIKLSGSSRVDEINGENIDIISSAGFLRKCRGKLKANNITGEKIHLECTTANSVDGEEVVVGDGCIIDLLKAENMKIKKGATVKRKEKK